MRVRVSPAKGYEAAASARLETRGCNFRFVPAQKNSVMKNGEKILWTAVSVVVGIIAYNLIVRPILVKFLPASTAANA